MSPANQTTAEGHSRTRKLTNESGKRHLEGAGRQTPVERRFDEGNKLVVPFNDWHVQSLGERHWSFAAAKARRHSMRERSGQLKAIATQTASKFNTAANEHTWEAKGVISKTALTFRQSLAASTSDESGRLQALRHSRQL